MTGYPPGGGYEMPVAGSVPVPQQRLRPGRIWYAVAFVVFLRSYVRRLLISLLLTRAQRRWYVSLIY